MKNSSTTKTGKAAPEPVFEFHATSNRPSPARTIRIDHMPQNIRAFAWIAGLSRPVAMGVRS